jgi:hypothetical protein
MAGAESKAFIGDSQWPRNTYRSHIADPVRDEGLAIPLSECQEYR